MKMLWKLITTNTGVGGVGEQGKFHYNPIDRRGTAVRAEENPCSENEQRRDDAQTALGKPLFPPEA